MSLGISLQNAFLREAKGKSREIALFRALQDAFSGLSGNALVEEYHGSRSQVRFTRHRRGGRITPQCELADLLLICYRRGDTISVRMTWLQAKLNGKPLLFPSFAFPANLEQWDLLCNRPEVRGAYRRFNPPPNLLSEAVLPSIGSFGVFYPVGATFDRAYFSADTLKPVNDHYSKCGTLRFQKPSCCLRSCQGHMELMFAGRLNKFGNALGRGLVGSPIQAWLNSRVVGIHPQPREWFSGLLQKLQIDRRASSLPGELLRMLELSTEAEPLEELPSRSVILVSYGDSDPEIGH